VTPPEAAPAGVFHELAAGAAVDARTALSGWRSEGVAPPGRPRVALNMITSVDARVTKDGRSGGLSSAADRELFHVLRAQADAVIAGANTVRIERYGPIIRDREVRERRQRAGLRPQPYAVIASHSGLIDPSLPILADPDSHVVVVGAPGNALPPSPATVDYIRTGSLREAASELRSRFAVELLLCEGGPTLAGQLLADGLIDELFLTLAPRLIGGPAGPSFLGSPAPADTALTLTQLLRCGDELFSRWRLAPS
jgi:riboflavin biosynthesis pyrimidine reductase